MNCSHIIHLINYMGHYMGFAPPHSACRELLESFYSRSEFISFEFIEFCATNSFNLNTIRNCPCAAYIREIREIRGRYKK